MSMVPEPEPLDAEVPVTSVGGPPEFDTHTEVVEADPKRPWKAYAAAAASGVTAFILYWVADEDPFTAKDAGEAFVAAVAASGFVGGTTFGVRNPLRSRRLP